jgi:hypothetical protein
MSWFGGLGPGGEVPLFDTWKFEEEKGLHHDESSQMFDMCSLEAYPCFSNTNDFLKVEKCPLKGRHPPKLGFNLCKK